MTIAPWTTSATSHPDHRVLEHDSDTQCRQFSNLFSTKLFKVAATNKGTFLPEFVVVFTAYFVPSKCFKLFIVPKFFCVMLFSVPVN